MCLSRSARQPDYTSSALLCLQSPILRGHAAPPVFICCTMRISHLCIAKQQKAICKVFELCTQANTLVANRKAACSCRQQRRRTKASYSAPVDVRDTVTRCIPLPSHWLAHHVRTSAAAEVLVSPGSCNLALPTQRPVIWCRLKALSNRAQHWTACSPRKSSNTYV